ncbi:unnamed protein product [Plutella xylostella]|uniref:Odorant receptor n=1 Tax=Plutella xylostella TaxID=51655 RepID=A0A8S4F3Q7_PLUXY|nr:unnamed protein product [Plutella xylostella]
MPFVVAGLLYIVASLTVLMAAKCSLTNFKGYQEIIRKLLQEFHLIHHSRGGAYEKKIIAKVDKISHYCTVYHMAIIFFIVLTFNGIPIFNSYKAGAFRGRNLSGMKLELAIYFRYPGFECLDYFYLLSFLNIYFTYIGAVAMFAIDAIVSAIIFQIIGHILILKHDIENLPEPKRETVVVFPHTGYEGHLGERVRLRLYDDEENKYIHNVLVGIIKHHKYILGYVNEVSGFFGPTVGLNYMFHLVAGCVLLLECIRCDQDVLLRNLTLVGVSLVNLAVHSVTFEIVGSYSEQLIDAVYSMPWESMDISNQKCMKLFLSRVQTPIRVTTMGVIPVGIQTMGAVSFLN